MAHDFTTSSDWTTSRGGDATVAAEARGLVNEGRRLAASLDVLVRTVRGGGSSVPGIAARCAGLWRNRAGLALVFRPTGILVSEQEVFHVGPTEGRWVLPTFMSGLRSLAATYGITVDDVLRMAEQLSGLEPTAEAITEFQDWLWQDGAEGFEVELQPSFVEAIETVGQTPANQGAGGAIRSMALQSIDRNRMMIASSDLDAAALRQEFEVSLELYARKIKRRELEFDEADCDLLVEACDRPSSWLRAEVATTLGQPALRAALPAARLARRIVAAASLSVDTEMLRLLARLGRREDPYLATLFDSLDALGFGRVLAHGVQLEDPDLADALVALLDLFPPDLTAHVLNGLLERIGSLDEVSPPILGLVERLGGRRLVELADLSTLQERGAIGLIRVVRAVDSDPAVLAALLRAVSAETAVSVISSLPSGVQRQLRETIGERLATVDDVRQVDSLVRVLLAQPDRESAELVAECLATTQGYSWRPQTLTAACQLLMAHDLGAPLVALARSRTASDRSRLTVLEQLRRRPALLGEAVAWSVSEMMESPTLKQRLKRLRSELKR